MRGPVPAIGIRLRGWDTLADPTATWHPDCSPPDAIATYPESIPQIRNPQSAIRNPSNPMATATPTQDIDDIRRQMAQIRRSMHQNMQNVVAGAEAVTDWRRYVRVYPWACVGGAALVGFLIVPRKRRSATRTAEKAADAAVERMQDTVEAARGQKGAKAEKEVRKKGMIGMLVGMAMPVAIRAAQNYASQYLENYLASNYPSPTPPGMSPGAAGGPIGPGPVPPRRPS